MVNLWWHVIGLRQHVIAMHHHVASHGNTWGGSCAITQQSYPMRIIPVPYHTQSYHKSLCYARAVILQLVILQHASGVNLHNGVCKFTACNCGVSVV